MTTSDRVDDILVQWRRERADLDVSPLAVIGRLHRVGDALRAELVRVYREHGLGEGEFDILATLRRTGAPYELTPSELSAQTMVTSGAVSKRLDRLEEDGLVTRRISEGDARGRIAALTPRGLALIDAAFEAHVANERRLLSAIPEKERAALERALRVWSLAIGL